METKTHFDLTSAIENWQQELSSQSLSAEDQRELKTHLCDAITELQKRGLNAEESFWLARRRVGDAQQLNEEFVKENPAAVWRERVMWMGIAVLAMWLWSSTASQTIWKVANSQTSFDYKSTISQWRWPILSVVWRDFPPIILAMLILRGSGRVLSVINLLFQSRMRFVLAASAWILTNSTMTIYPQLIYLSRHPNNHDPIYKFNLSSMWCSLISVSVWSILLVALIAWLMPAKRQMSSRTA